MKIVRIKVDSFGKLKDLDLQFDSHFNIVYGRNESGKSTLHSFIRSMILGMEKNDHRYLPWGNEKRFGGSLYLEDDDGNEQKITRDFLSEDLDAALIEFPSVLYDNTINIEQYLLNFSKAKEYLNTYQQEIEKKIPANREYGFNEEEEFENQSSDLYKKIEEAQGLNNKIQKQIQEFKSKKGELEKSSKSSCELLVKHEFYKEEDVKDCKENTEKLLEKYQEELEKDTKEVSLVNPYLLGIAGVLFLMNLLFVKNTILGVGCVFFAIAYLLFQIIHKPMNFNEDLEIEEQIEEIYQEFLGNGEITKENHEKFGKEMNRYLGFFKQVSDEQLKLEKIGKEIEKLEGYQKRMESEIKELKKKLWISEGKASKSYVEELENKQRKEEVQLKGQLEEDLEAISLSKEVLNSLSEKIFESSVEQINQRASDIVSKMTDGRYQKVMINSKFDMTIQTGNKFISIESLSKGTIEQIYLALRLAIIEWLWPDEEMPLLLDDSFVFYDDERLEQTLYYLYEYYNGQIILFTCHKRENEIANKLEFFYRNLTLDT